MGFADGRVWRYYISLDISLKYLLEKSYEVTNLYGLTADQGDAIVVYRTHKMAT